MTCEACGKEGATKCTRRVIGYIGKLCLGCRYKPLKELGEMAARLKEQKK